MIEQRLNSEVKIKVLNEPMNNPLGVSPGKENHEIRKKPLNSLGIEPKNSRLNLPLLFRLSYGVGQTRSGTILGCESRRRESKGTYECCAAYKWWNRELTLKCNSKC